MALFITRVPELACEERYHVLNTILVILKPLEAPQCVPLLILGQLI